MAPRTQPEDCDPGSDPPASGSREVLQTQTTRPRLTRSLCGHKEGIRQYDSSDTGHSDNVNIAAEHQEPAEVLSQLDNTSNSPVNGEYKCC